MLEVFLRVRVRGSASVRLRVRSCGVVTKKCTKSQPPAPLSFSWTITIGKPLARALRTWVGVGLRLGLGLGLRL